MIYDSNVARVIHAGFPVSDMDIVKMACMNDCGFHSI